MFNETPKSSRIHIAIIGRRNVGKSCFMNAFLNQDLSIVSSTPGTTTDPVEKAYELQPIGPVLLIDTAGIDDVGALGEKRIEKSKAVIKRADLVLLLVEKDTFGDFEKNLIQVLKKDKIPFVLVFNKIDAYDSVGAENFLQDLRISFPIIACSSLKKQGIDEVREFLARKLEDILPGPLIIADLVKPLDTVILVIPVDKEAPKGRIILPQVQTLRELLDVGAIGIVVKETELQYSLETALKQKPYLVVTDSQAFKEVAETVPENILLTSFSMLFARHKGDLKAYVEGVRAIDKLKNGDAILIAELCSHRPIGEDIGRIKIPRWLKQLKGLDLKFDIAAGKDFPADLSKYKLIIQCGGCMVNRRLILSRIEDAKKQNIPITNYGVAIAYLHVMLERVLKPFKL